jgi:hypothetical protein
MSDQSFDEIVSAVEAVRIETPDGFDEWSVPIQGEFDQLGWTQVRPDQAVEAVKHPTAIAVYGYADLRWFMSTRKRSGAAYVVLVVGDVRDKQRLIRASFRVKGSEDLARDPARAFATLLQSSGVDYTAGRRRVRFVPVVMLPHANTPREAADALDFEQRDRPDGDRWFMGQMGGAEEGGAKVAWPFVIDAIKYAAALRDP